jgi:hypothetical protein
MKQVEFREPKLIEIRIDREGHHIGVVDAYGDVHTFDLEYPAGEGVHYASPDVLKDDGE